MSSRGTPHRPGALLGACLAVGALLTVLLPTTAVGTAGAASGVVAARAADPAKDRPTLPARCRADSDQHLSKPGPCYVTRFDRTRPTVMLWGDSHAYHHIPAVRAAVRGQNVNFLVFIAGACPPMVRIANQQDTCSVINRQALEFVTRLQRNDRPLTVLLGSYWHWYLSTLERIDAGDQPEADEAYIFEQSREFRRGVPRMFRTLGRMRVETDVLGPVPTVPDVVDSCPEGENPYACRIKRGQALPDEGKTRAYVVTQMKALHGRPRLINLKPRMCDKAYCYGRRDGVYTWYDGIHLSATFSRSTTSAFRGIVRDVKR
ncbi:MAG: SGNH hydrolase domain-containing protein [Nocardioides sp.]|nr:SGNH hydrolase domain-containing protein [Nocardioides sp.]